MGTEGLGFGFSRLDYGSKFFLPKKQRPVQRLSICNYLRKKSFTGRKTDKLGRENCYQEGRKVPCGNSQSQPQPQPKKPTPQRNPTRQAIQPQGILTHRDVTVVGSVPPPRLNNWVNTVEALATEKLPQAARERFLRYTHSVRFCASVEVLNQELLADHPDLAPQMTAKNNQFALAAYSPEHRTLYLDGGLGGAIDRVYSHELGHCIDGPEYELSGSREWQAIWNEEIYREKNPPLSHYSNYSRVEAWAEFCAAMYSGEVDLTELEKRLPRAAKYARELKLWPEK